MLLLLLLLFVVVDVVIVVVVVVVVVVPIKLLPSPLRNGASRPNKSWFHLIFRGPVSS